MKKAYNSYICVIGSFGLSLMSFSHLNVSHLITHKTITIFNITKDDILCKVFSISDSCNCIFVLFPGLSAFHTFLFLCSFISLIVKIKKMAVSLLMVFAGLYDITSGELVMALLCVLLQRAGSTQQFDISCPEYTLLS